LINGRTSHGTSNALLGLLLTLAACGFPKPADVPGDGAPSDAAAADTATTDAPADAPDDPRFLLHVSPTGDDANDGIALPVKTLKHALGIAAANKQITKIVLASGRYSGASGETFPYTVPGGVTVAGPAGGGAILAGSKTEPALTVDAGTLDALELEDFAVAIVATGVARVSNVRIRSSAVAVRAETAAELTVDNLDVTGTVAACASGIVLNGAADLTVTTLATRNLSSSLDAKDQSTVHLTGANVAGDPGCMTQGGPARYVMSGNTTKTVVLRDSLVDGGSFGLTFGNAQVTITNTIVRNMKFDGVDPGSGGWQMIGGEVSNNGVGLEGGNPNNSFTNVTFAGTGLVIYWFGTGSSKLVLRGCTLGGLIQLENAAVADLGTTTSPGNNTFRPSQGVGLEIIGGGAPVDAVGNTWKPSAQGADAQGHYAPGTSVQGPIAGASTDNFTVGTGRVLNL
jgi:hypothetical protein